MIIVIFNLQTTHLIKTIGYRSMILRSYGYMRRFPTTRLI